MTAALATPLLRPTVRHFSAHRPKPNSRASRIVAMSCIVSAVVLPFVPPALESSKERNLGYPNHNKWVSRPPFLFSFFLYDRVIPSFSWEMAYDCLLGRFLRSVFMLDRLVFRYADWGVLSMALLISAREYAVCGVCGVMLWVWVFMIDGEVHCVGSSVQLIASWAGTQLPIWEV